MHFSRLAEAVSAAVGRSWAFFTAIAVVLTAIATAALVPGWREPINIWGGAVTGYVSIVLLVLLQHTQNRDGLAIQTKLDALIKASGASNAFAGIDRLDEDQLRQMRED
jgi:low affinity Fe/Cu permease